MGTKYHAGTSASARFQHPKDTDKMQAATFELWAERYGGLNVIASAESQSLAAGALSFVVSRYTVPDNWQNNKPASVKEIRVKDERATSFSDTFCQTFMTRIRRLQSLKHPSLPTLMDFYMRDMSKIYIVQQGMENCIKLEDSRLTPIQAVGLATQLCGLLIHLDEMIPDMVLATVVPSQLLVQEATIKVADCELLYTLGCDLSYNPELSLKTSGPASLAVALQLMTKQLEKEYKPLQSMQEKLRSSGQLSLVKARADLRQLVSRLKVTG